MKRIKRLLSGLIAVLLFISPCISILPANATEANALFCDEFTNTNLSGWHSNDMGTVTDESYQLTGSQYNYVEILGTKEKIVIEAPTSVAIGKNQSGELQNSMASLVLCGNDVGTVGYEFSIGISKLGTTFARLYKRSTDGSSQILRQMTTNIPGVTGGILAQRTTYNLKMGIVEGQIRCFINEELVFAIQDNTYSSGYAGVKSTGGLATFDYVKVTEAPKKVVESISVENAPDAVSILTDLEFNIAVNYGGYYGTEIISSETEGVSITGFNRTVGKKTITVKYAGKTDNFSLNVQKTYPEKVLFEDSFNTNETSFTISSSTDGNLKYGLTVNDGQLEAMLPNNIGGYDSPARTVATMNENDIADWGRYSITVHSTIHKACPTKTSRVVVSEIRFAKEQDGSIWKFRVDDSGMAYLYRGDTILLSKDLNAAKIAPIYGETFSMNVTVNDHIVTCKYKGKTIFTYAGFERSKITPYMVLAAMNGNVSFQDVKVVETEKKAAEAATGVQLLFTRTDGMVSSYSGNELDTSGTYLKVTYQDGTIDAVGISQDMVSGYTPGKSTTITIRYGKWSKNVPYTYTAFLFQDSFEQDYKPEWSMASKKQFATAIKNNALNFAFVRESTSNVSLLSYVSTGTEWSDYAVSADVTFAQGEINKTYQSIIGLVARKTGNCYYELRLRAYYGTITAYLYRFDDAGSEKLCYWNSAAFKSFLTHNGLEYGQVYNLKMVCKENLILCYVGGHLLGTYTDDSEKALYSGTAGFKVVNFNGSMDNYTVEKMGIGTFTNLIIPEVKDNTFYLYEGFEIDPTKYTVTLMDSNGFETNVRMTDEMLSAYDSLSPGKQTVDVTALGYTGKVTVIVEQRPDYVKDINSQLEKLKVKKLGLDDKGTIDEFQDLYDTLSPYEVTLLSEKAVKNLQKAVQEIEQLQYSELTEYDKLLWDSMNESDTDAWSDGLTVGIGSWKIRNSYLGHYQSEYAVWGNGYYSNQKAYGNLVSVSADVMMLEPDVYIGITLNENEDGYYQARISSKTRDDYGNVTHTLQLYRRGTDEALLGSTTTEAFDISLKDCEWFNMRMTFVKGMLRVYVNDVEMLSYDDSTSVTPFEIGTAGVTVSESNGRFDNFMVYGTAVEQEKPVPVTPVVYEDDFEDEAENANPDYWLEPATYSEGATDCWSVYKLDGNKVYGTKKANVSTYTYLHAFDKNTTATMRMMLREHGKDSKFGFIFRMAPESSYVRVGYDANSEKWYMESVKGNGEDDVIIYAEKTFEMEKNKWYSFDVTLNENNIEFKVDNKKVLSTEQITADGYGRIGVFSENAATYIDDVKFTIASGVMPNDGVHEFTFTTEEMYSNMEIESVGENTLIGVMYNRNMVFVSTDNGLTWDDVTENAAYASLLEGSGYTSFLQMEDGTYMQLVMSDMTVYTSEDMLNWTQIGRILPEDELADDRNRQLTVFHANSLCQIKKADGSSRLIVPISYRLFPSETSTSSSGNYSKVYYSDDGGKTWQAANNDTRDILIYYEETNTSSKWAESKIIQCSDGTLRMYVTRTNEGCLQYTESKDYGATWSGLYQIPEMQCAASSFSVMEDPTQKGTFYLVWVNDNLATYGSLQNRTRISLAKSTNGKDWEFLCDLERMCVRYSTDPASNSPLYQLLDPSLEVTDKYVYVTFGRSEDLSDLAEQGTAANYHNFQQVRYVRLEKDKLSVKKWDSATISDMKFPVSIEVAEAPDKVKFGLGDIFAVLGGSVKVTALDGSVSMIDLSRFNILEEPDMWQLGTQTITIYNKNCQTSTFDITIVQKYSVKWEISEGGSIEPKSRTVLEGDDFTFELKPDVGYKVSSVIVNDEKVSVKKGKVTILDVKQDLKIVVQFAPMSVLDYLIYIVPTVLLIGVCGWCVYCHVKKSRNKMGSSDKEIQE